jgi:CRP-like cAMP-binding protein
MTAPTATRAFLYQLAPDDADALRACGVERRYGGGVAILHQGDDSAGVLVLLEGRVKVSLMPPGGREVIVDFAGPGDIIGELAAIEGTPRSASVFAIEPVRALVVPRDSFERLLTTRPSITLAVLRRLAARLHAADEQRLQFSAHDVLGRVAHALLVLSDRYGRPSDRGIEITLPLSQDELAAWTASSREGVAKALHILRRLGWVETHRRRTVVLDLHALRSHVS